MNRFACSAILLTAWCLLTGAAYRQTDPVNYTIKPTLVGNALVSLQVKVDMPVNVGMVQTLALPKRLRDAPIGTRIRLEGGEILEVGPLHDWMRVRATAPKITFRYDLPSDGSNDLATDEQGPVVRNTWFALRGEDALILSEGSDRTPATARLTGFPVGWNVSSSLSDSVTMARLRDSLILGGRNYQIIERMVDGTPLRLAYPHALSEKASALIGEAARVVSAERRFWRAAARPFYVGVVALNDDGDFGGRGLEGGFILYLGKNTPRDSWLRLIAHENLHTWISRQIGGFPAKNDDLEAWLNEGFTEAYTARILLEAGLWSPDQFVADWNASLVRYGTSPVKAAPNARILADRQRDFNVNKLPYDRGRLLAVLWDQRFRGRTHGRIGLDEVLRAQERQARLNAQRGETMSADQLFPMMAKRLTGVDLSADLARYVDLGEPLTLPTDAFGSCIQVVQVTQPIFDRGFNFGDTLKAHGRLTGLEPEGPAEKAGLREGDKLSIDEIPGHDSRVTLHYSVDEGQGMRRNVSYKPEGATTVTFQQLELKPLRHTQTAQCRAAMLRP